MTLFPKKYTTKDLQRLQTQYQLAHPTSSSAFSLFSLPANQNFHLGHLYGIYLQDFINQSATTPNLLPHKGVIFEPKGMLSIYQAQQFFAKKRQTLSQIGTTKLLTYLKAQQEKKTKANQKMLKAYAGIPAETFTYTTEFSQFILENFAKLRESGKITSRKNIGYRSIDLQSTLADQDIIRKKEQGKNYTIKYFIETKSDILPVCSEVPDTIFGDVALLVHPQDKRYKKLVGKNAIIPIVNRMIPILTDESVDFSKGNGVKRVNPCADFASIALAEKYKLPLDHYIFDKEGKYTEYAGSEYQGKSRKDFYDNIVQYLEDISNLGQIYNQEILAPYYRHSQERLYPFLVEEVVTNLKTDKETLLTTIEGKKLFPETQEGILSAIRNVSGVINRQIPRGIPVPLVKDTKGYKHFNPTLLENGAYTEEIQRYFDFSLLWLSLHHYLKPSFDFTQLLRALTQQKGHLANTLNLLRKSDKKADKPIQKLLTLLERLTEEEKPLNDFEKLIQDSQVLRPQEEEFFLALPQKKEAIVFLGATFDTDFLASLYPIFLAEQKKTIAPAIPLEEGRERRLASELVRQQALLGKPLFTEATLFPGYIDPKKQERFSYETLQTNQIFTLLDEYGVAPLRISLLVQNGFSLESIWLYDNLLKQIWNGVRYVASTTNGPLSLAEAIAEFDKKADTLDHRMMGEFLVLRQEYSTLTTYETKLHFFPQIQQFIQKKLFARYLEVRKVQTEGSIQATLAIIFSAIFQMLHPFAPAYIQSLLQVSGYQWEPLIHFPSLKKTSLDIEMMFELFEMIYTFKLRLNIKKHQKIILFFKSDPNSLALFTERGKIIKALFNVEQITFVRLHEQNPTGYEIENLHSTIVGIKIQSPATSAKKPTLAELQQQYNQQLEYFELLRNLIINFSTTSYESNPQFDAKKKEMEAVKLRLEKMNLEIQKLKMK